MTPTMGNTYENARANVLIKISKLTIPPQKDYNISFLTNLFLLKLFSQPCKRYNIKKRVSTDTLIKSSLIYLLIDRCLY